MRGFRPSRSARGAVIRVGTLGEGAREATQGVFRHSVSVGVCFVVSSSSRGGRATYKCQCPKTLQCGSDLFAKSTSLDYSLPCSFRFRHSAGLVIPPGHVGIFGPSSAWCSSERCDCTAACSHRRGAWVPEARDATFSYMRRLLREFLRHTVQIIFYECVG